MPKLLFTRSELLCNYYPTREQIGKNSASFIAIHMSSTTKPMHTMFYIFR